MDAAILESRPILRLGFFMYHYPADIYTEPEPDTEPPANLGPLTGMAGNLTHATGPDIDPDGTWSYDQDTLLTIPGQTETFHHTDRNRLRKIAEPTPNPTALATQQAIRPAS